jgi:predicted enzyme related to lactoylglutathione lyase
MSPFPLINIDVDDLGRATSFYTAALGLKVGRTLGPSVVELLGDGSPIYLLEKTAGSIAAPAIRETRRYERHWTPVHLDFAVPNLDEGVRRAVAAGATLEVPAVAHAWGKIAELADPFGHGFCLIEFSATGYDAIATD